MRTHLLLLNVLLTASVSVSLLVTAKAADAQMPQMHPVLPPVPAPPATAAAPNGEFVAPLSQTTQPSYLPQSVALSGPRMIKDWHEGLPVPYGYHPETRTRKGLIISGALVFGVPYLYSGLIASAGSDVSSSTHGSNQAAALYIPVLGPFIEMGQTDSATAHYVLVLDGLAQAAGAAMFIYGLAYPKIVLVRNDLAMVTIIPTSMGKSSQGLALIGTF